MRFLLDTDTCIYAMKGRVQQLERYEPTDCGISTIVYGELMYGAYRSKRVEHNLKEVSLFVDMINVVCLDSACAENYGEIRASLASKGEIIGGNDLWIAAHAKTLGLTLITNNQREFKRVRGLKIANWLDE